MKKLLCILLFFVAFGAKAQETYSISGVVTDEKGETMPGVTVFITNSKYSTSSNNEGRFNFNNIPSGNYELVFKMLGYAPEIKNITLQGRSVNINAQLKTNNITLKTVTIRGNSTDNNISAFKRSAYMALFTNNFIGQTVNAEQCTLLNPEVLHFNYDREKDALTATADDFIIVENKALGYKLKYLLTEFEVQFKNHLSVISGSPYFEELKGTESQQKKWEANRKAAYLSSSRHFFKAVMNNTAKEEGYLFYRFLNIPDSPGKRGYTIIRPASIDSLFIDDSRDFKVLTSNATATGKDTSRWGIYIVYTGQKESALFFKTGSPIDLPVKLPKQRQISELTPLAEKILIDNNGGLTPTKSFIYGGYWGWERAADLTPLDYAVPPPPSATGKLRDIAASLDIFNKKVAVEKVHIQLDKPYYMIGDTLWMKAYVVNESNETSNQSKILYADLLDSRDSVKTSLTIPLTQGLGWASIPLTDSLLNEGTYHLRAYTTLMRNFGNDYFFNKEIKIGNLQSILSGFKFPTGQPMAGMQPASGKNQAADVSVKFFPEGGEMVNNIMSKIGFKVIATDGTSREASGYIVDEANKQVTSFHTEHAGMGSFLLQPVAGNSYTAIVKLADSSEKRVTLPKVLDDGYSLSVNQSEDNIIVSISATRALLKNGEVTLVGQANNIIRYTGKKDLSGNGITTMIPKSRFPEGIAQFTLFSPGYQPVAERLVFVRNTDKHLNIKITPNKAGYKTRDKVHLDLAVTDQQGTPVSGSFSLAITSEDLVPYTEAEETTLFSDLLLTADLKGYIEHPNYYFTDVNTDKERQLDNLLLTQGWRRFIWADVVADKLPPQTFRPETGIGLSGRIVTSKGLPAVGAKVYVLFGTAGGTLIDTVTTADGRFNFDNLNFNKGINYNVAATDAKGKKNVKVVLDEQKLSLPEFQHLPFEPALSNDFDTYLETAKKQAEEQNKGSMTDKAIALREVNIREKRKTARDIALQDSKNHGVPTFTFTFVDLSDAHDLGAFLIGNIYYGLKIRRGALGRWDAGAYEVIVDGEQRDMEYYNTLLPEQIAAIEVIEGQANNNTNKKYNGSIVITLKKPGVNYQKYVDEYKVATAAKKEDEQKQAIALKEVVIQEKRENQVRKIALQDSKNPARPELDDAIFTFVDLAKAATVGQFLRSHLEGVHVNVSPRDNNVWEAVYNGSIMEVAVDGYPRKKDFYSVIPADQIAAIEVTKGSSIGSTSGGSPGGTINITLKHPGANHVDYDKYMEEAENQQRLADAVKKADGQKAIALKEVTIKEKKLAADVKAVAVENSSNLAGPGNADQVLTFIDLLPCGGNLAQCLQGRVTNVVFKPGKDGNMAAYARNFDSPMLIVVDGVAGRSLDEVITSDVASVEVLRGGGAATLYGMKAANGVIIITTKKGGVDYLKYEMEHYVPGYTKPMPKLITYKFQRGYDLRRQFYSPDYDNPATNKQLADQRTTIYWNPNIITDANGKASVEFFNADATGNYRVITEGLDGLGKLGRELIKYVVR